MTAGDYRINNEKVTYSLNTTCYAKTGFMINVNGAIPWSGQLELSLNPNKKSVSVYNNGSDIDYYKLGEIDGSYISKEATISEDTVLEIVLNNKDKIIEQLRVYGYTDSEAYEIADSYIEKRKTCMRLLLQMEFG